MNNVSNCIVCGHSLSGKQRSFCSNKCKNDYYLSYDALKKRALARKSRLLSVNGGSCVRCGYAANIDALSFYDKDGNSLHIDTNVLANSNYEKLTKKLRGALVLCRNCVEELNSTPVSSRPSETSGEIPQKKTAKKFAENLALCGVKPGQTIVLGVSGGVDSVTALDLFAKSELKLNIVVAHMNHGIREGAVNDEKLVHELAHDYGFTYNKKTLKHSHIRKNMRMLSGDTSNNLEENLRNERRRFLLEMAEKYKAAFVALAHNANDQAETFLLNAVRGSGPAGLGAMSMSDDKIIRPLLNFSRAEIEGYAREHKLTWNEDETNKDISYDRNYVRHRVLPLLARLNSEYLNNIVRTTGLQRQIDDHLKEEAYRAMRDTNCEHLRRLDKPLLYEVLGLLYEEVKGNRQGLSLVHLQAVADLISETKGTKTLDLPGNIVARRTYDKLDFYVKTAHNVPSTPSTLKLTIGEQKFGGWKVTVAVKDSRLRENDEIDIDAKTLPNLVIRTREPGDRIASISPRGTKKLQDLFVDAKIDRAKRSQWPIIVDTRKGQIVWVPGLAKSTLKPKTKKLLTINIVEVEHETN